MNRMISECFVFLVSFSLYFQLNWESLNFSLKYSTEIVLFTKSQSRSTLNDACNKLKCIHKTCTNTLD
jgi:hypothetical protein